MNKLLSFFLAVLVEGLGCLAFFLAIPADPKNAWLFGLSLVRLGLSLIFLLVILFSLSMIWGLYKQSNWANIIYTITGQIYFHNGRLLLVGSLSITVIFLCIGFFLSWYVLSQEYHAVLLRLSPIVLFLLLSNATFLFTTRDRFYQIWSSSGSFQRYFSKFRVLEITLVVFFLIMGVHYYEVAMDHASELNNSPKTNDQSAYLNFSEKVWDSNFRYMGSRNRMPVYAYLQAAFYRPTMSDNEFFIQAKQVNIILSLVLLTLTFFILRRYLSILPAIDLILIFAFGLYVFKAGYVQVELLFYFMVFVLIILMVKMLISPSIKLGILTGIWLGITQLSKAAVLPLLALFTIIFLTKETIELIPRLRSYGYKGYHISLLYRLSSLLVVIVCFLIMVYPYISESKRIYGHYFYNVNSTFYIWYDSWDEVKQGTRAYGDRVGWPDMPENQIPTFSKYIREHSPSQIYQRLSRGLENQFYNLVIPYSFFNYSLIYLSVLLVFGLINYKSSARLIQKYFWPMIFFLGFLIGYLISYAWFSPLTDWSTHRFTYTLFLPFLFWVSITVHKLVAESSEVELSERNTKPGKYLKLIDIMILGLIILDIIQYIPGRVMSAYFGS